MTYFADLTPYSYKADSPPMLNVGWLAAGHAFPTAPPPAKLVAQLGLRVESAAHLTGGFHPCDLCNDTRYAVRILTASGEMKLGNGELHVMAQNGSVYAAPTLVVHYVRAHSYQPPAAFTAAVMAQTTGPTSDELPTFDDVISNLDKGEVAGLCGRAVECELFEVYDPEIVGWSYTVRHGDIVVYALQALFVDEVAVLTAIPGVEEVVHDDRCTLLVRGSGPKDALADCLSAFWDAFTCRLRALAP